jgi:hypothetical protein
MVGIVYIQQNYDIDKTAPKTVVRDQEYFCYFRQTFVTSKLPVKAKGDKYAAFM